MDNIFTIPLGGLAQGHTGFIWTIGKDFFLGFGNTEISDAELSVKAEIEKSGRYLGIDCTIAGTLTVPCDRCLADVVYPIDAAVKLSVKYGSSQEESEDGDREIILLPENGTELDLSQTIYDYSCLALPIQRKHKDGECDPETVRHLGIGQPVCEQVKDKNNPFAALKGMFEN